ncbi:MAG: hypothetical protein AB1Z65_10430 [Candidatus Sulfomarinibacteraceae bacterium]
MSRCLLSAFALSIVLAPWTTDAADVTGVLLYDGQPVSAIFPDITHATVMANPWDPGSQIEGTVDLVTSTYTVTGLEAARYGLSVYLDRTPPVTDVGNPGDLQAYLNIEPTDPQATLEQDLDILYNYHVVSPIDANADLDGMGLDCTAYPEVAFPITFAIEPVPRASNYVFIASLNPCPGGALDLIEIPTDQTSAVIEWGTVNEDFQQLWVRCLGDGGKPLCTGTTYRYTDAHVWGLFLRNREGAGRGTHRTDSVVIPAVASASGAHGTHWTSAVSLTNLTTTDRTIEVIYTPRGVDGLSTYQEAELSLPASAQLSWSDVMDELFSATGAGALEFRGHQLAVTSRTSTPGAAEGSYGQGIPPLQPEQVLRLGAVDSATMGGVEEGEVFRTNLGLCEIWGESATVRITVFDATMSELGFQDTRLRPYENIQINQVAKTVAGAATLSDGIVEVTVTGGNGRIGAYLSVVDNATGDPTFIAIARQTPAGS